MKKTKKSRDRLAEAVLSALVAGVEESEEVAEHGQVVDCEVREGKVFLLIQPEGENPAPREFVITIEQTVAGRVSVPIP